MAPFTSDFQLSTILRWTQDRFSSPQHIFHTPLNASNTWGRAASVKLSCVKIASNKVQGVENEMVKKKRPAGVLVQWIRLISSLEIEFICISQWIKENVDGREDDSI